MRTKLLATMALVCAIFSTSTAAQQMAPRIHPLPLFSAQDIGVDASGVVHVAGGMNGNGAIYQITLDPTNPGLDSMTLETKSGVSPTVWGIASDASYSCGDSGSSPSVATYWLSGNPIGIVVPGIGMTVSSELGGITNVNGNPVMVGQNIGRPYMYDPVNGLVQLMGVAGDAAGEVYDISTDGSVIVGTADSPSAPSGAAMVWINGVPTELPRNGGAGGNALTVSFDGQNYGGEVDFRPAIWLASESHAYKELLDPTGAQVIGQVNDIADDGMVYGQYLEPPTYFNVVSFVWHPSFPDNKVQKFDDFLTQNGLTPPTSYGEARGLYWDGSSYMFAFVDTSFGTYFICTDDLNTGGGSVWTTYGQGNVGSNGLRATLDGTGSGNPGTQIVLTTNNAKGNSLTALFASLTPADTTIGGLPFFIDGSSLIAVGLAPTNSAGTSSFNIGLPSSLQSGVIVHFQTFTVDLPLLFTRGGLPYDASNRLTFTSP